MCMTHLCSCVSWCILVAWILVQLTSLFTFGRNTGTEHQIHSPMRMTMVTIEPPSAHRQLHHHPSPRLSIGIVLVCCATCCTTTASPAFRSDGNSIDFLFQHLLLRQWNVEVRDVVSNPFYQNSSCVLCCHAALHLATNDVGGSHLLYHVDNPSDCSSCFCSLIHVSYPYHTCYIPYRYCMYLSM